MDANPPPNSEEVERFDFHRINLVATFQLACLKAGLETGYVIHPKSFSRISQLEYHENGIEASELQTFRDAYIDKGGELKWLDLFKKDFIKANLTKNDHPFIEERITAIEEFEVPLYKTALDQKYYVARKETAAEPSPSKKQYDGFMQAYMDYGGNREKIPIIEEACGMSFPEFNPADALVNVKVLYRRTTWIAWYNNIAW